MERVHDGILAFSGGTVGGWASGLCGWNEAGIINERVRFRLSVKSEEERTAPWLAGARLLPLIFSKQCNNTGRNKDGREHLKYYAQPCSSTVQLLFTTLRRASGSPSFSN
eukprot:scaffold1051_cov188-Alexandrium_tamarense.AAC.1